MDNRRNPTTIVLGSASPRRRELLGRLGLPFVVAPSDVDETTAPGLAPEEVADLLGLRKARAVATDHPDAAVIGADTVVALPGTSPTILGKPRDDAEAAWMLRTLRGRWHRVSTGIAVIRAGREWHDVVTAEVRMGEYSDAEIATYVASGEPRDKGRGLRRAGARWSARGRGARLGVGRCRPPHPPPRRIAARGGADPAGRSGHPRRPLGFLNRASAARLFSRTRARRARTVAPPPASSPRPSAAHRLRGRSGPARRRVPARCRPATDRGRSDSGRPAPDRSSGRAGAPPRVGCVARLNASVGTSQIARPGSARSGATRSGSSPGPSARIGGDTGNARRSSTTNSKRSAQAASVARAISPTGR